MCGPGCGGGHDPYADRRNKGKRMSRGTSVGVTKSDKRLAREAAGQKLEVSTKKADAIKAIAEKNKGLSSSIPASGIIKSKKRAAREKKAEKLEAAE